MNVEKKIVENLENKGWTKQFTANEPRLSEAVEMYQQAGFEVHLEPLSREPACEACEGVEEEKECRVCFEGVEGQYRMIFTRRR